MFKKDDKKQVAKKDDVKKEAVVNSNDDKELEDLQSMLDDVKEDEGNKEAVVSEDQIAQLLAEIVKLNASKNYLCKQ